MTGKKDFKSLTEQLHANAIEEFKLTKQYKLLAEKLERMNRDCQTMFTRDEQEFAEECFDLLLNISGQQEQFIYQKGLLDSVNLLKNLGVLA